MELWCHDSIERAVPTETVRESADVNDLIPVAEFVVAVEVADVSLRIVFRELSLGDQMIFLHLHRELADRRDRETLRMYGAAYEGGFARKSCTAQDCALLDGTPVQPKAIECTVRPRGPFKMESDHLRNRGCL